MSYALVSVIIPVYNVEKYLDRCMECVLNQTYKNLEIILVDDGSTDSSSKLCDEYEKKDNRIMVIHKENGGLSSARNTGISVANGDYIVFVDSDDVIHRQMIQILLYHIECEGIEIAQCARYEISEDEYNALLDEDRKNLLEKDMIPMIFNNTSDSNMKVQSGRAAVAELYKEDSVDYIVAWNKIYKREIFNELRFAHGKIHEDEFTTPYALLNASKIVYDKLPLYIYIRRDGSITTKKYSIKNIDLLEALLKRMELFKLNGLEELLPFAANHFVGQTIYEISRVLKMREDNIVIDDYTNVKKYLRMYKKKSKKYYFKYLSAMKEKKYRLRMLLRDRL